MLDVVETLTKIETDAKANAVHETRRVEIMQVGQVVRQGDIYVHRVADDHARGQTVKTRQLVRGVTNGSRHVVASRAQAFEGTAPPPWAPRSILGPLVVTDRRLSITHPEHAWLDLPAGTYQVTLQLDARTNAAVQD